MSSYRGADIEMVVVTLDYLLDGPHWPLKIWSVITEIIND